ncbi:DENN domain-containing protein 5A [Phytophthora cinnamomi]|uniref:DENN domain-containing protein 5A n=1 Tax=Phytophthora cinnamomi TaxID=4785 RepID=UPI00355A180A|nr:DENN domain-containing protein 5A [Phytophthora cinnamomi]
MDKPMVKSIDASRPKEYDRVAVGDILEAVDSIATASMSFEQTMILLEKGNRPMRLRFRRPQSAAQTSPTATKRLKYRRCLSASSIDILHRARRLKINDPGHWSTARFPSYDFSYQFPKRHSDRWSVGVVLRFLAPDKVVEIMAYLLLEKQVVIMGDSPAKVSAVCTALLLLLAPFQWQSTYIPLLPAGLLDFLHSPVPFLAGCHLLNETSEWSDVCFYDIDRDRIAVPAVTRHLGPTSIPNGVELCRLLRKAKERLCALRPTGKPWYELSDEQDTIITLTMQEAEIFLRDLGFDISSQDLAASISGGQSFYDRLQEEVAKEVRNSMYEDYLDEFTQTQLFCQYYESLLQPEAQKAQKH